MSLASNWPPKSSGTSKNRFFPQWQAQRTFLRGRGAKLPDTARLCGFFYRPLSVPFFRYLPLSYMMRQFLKIRWANHPCGFDPRRRHQDLLSGPCGAGREVFSRGANGSGSEWAAGGIPCARNVRVHWSAPRPGLRRSEGRPPPPAPPRRSKLRSRRFRRQSADWRRKLCTASLLLLSKPDPLRWAPVLSGTE